MPTLSQLPGVLDIEVSQGDELNIPINLYLDVRGYTFECWVYQLVEVTDGGGFVYTAKLNFFQPTVGVVDAVSGSLVIGLSEAQTLLMLPDYTAFRWYLRWVAPGQITRTIVSGSITTRHP